MKYRILPAVAVILVLLVGIVAPRVRAEGESPYKISEFAVKVAPGNQTYPVISGKWAVWLDDPSHLSTITGRNLETGQDFAISATDTLSWPVDVAGDTVVATATRFGDAGAEYSIFVYRLPNGQPTVIAPFKSPNTSFVRGAPRTDGKTVVWAEGDLNNSSIYAYDLAGQRLIPVSTNPAYRENPSVSGNFVVWRDKRNSNPTSIEEDIYGYDLSSSQEFRITANPEMVSPPAISGNTVVWIVQRGSASYLLGYDLAKKQAFTISHLPSSSGYAGPDISGDIVVWSAKGDLDEDVFGYDLKQGKQFIISRAIGAQTAPRISGKTVVWMDYRRSGVGKYESDSDIYGATLDPGPAPVPPIIGAPDAVDAKVEIVWPQGGVPVTDADKANVGVWLFLPNTLKPAPCQWNPTVQLWKALNNDPAKLVAVGQKQGNRYYFKGRAMPAWEFNDVDVSAARDPKNRIYFFVTVDGVSSRTNVWSHGVDARTYFPQQDVPGGVTQPGGTVEGKIEIVWPHDNAPVDQAKQVNVSASLFSPGTLLSVPQDWNPTVRLYRALNNGIAEQVASGQKRIVSASTFVYPVWDFNDIDVSAANDPANKYYFTLSVDGVTAFTNVWAHGADARTYFPQMDTPTQDCRGG